jgi:hypothetical protein
MATAIAPVSIDPALAAPVQFIGGADPDHADWNDPNNWSTTSVPGSGDDVTIPLTDYGPQILDGQSGTANSIEIGNSFSVGVDSTLTVIDHITNDGPGYFVNAGTITVKNGGTVGTVTNTYTDDDQFGYIGNSHVFTANLDNSGAVVNGDGADGLTGVSWTGNVVNRATGYISNTGALWTGDVTSNLGSIYNDYGSTWDGAIQSNSAFISNDGGSSWTGKVVGNDANGVIVNIEGATWTGDVQSNDGSVDNDGGTWNGNVLANTGSVFNTADSTWNGNMTSSGSLWLNGAVNGFVDNEGGTLYVVNGDLSGVTTLTNNGDFTMQDDIAGGRLSAQSWSGTGTATFDFAPGLGLSDHVVLSGDYTADTTLNLSLVGPSGRALVDIPLITVGGADTGTLDVSGLPDDGVISYRLVQNDEAWIVTTTLNDAPEHAASAAALLARTTAEATLVPTDHAASCGNGRWMRALGGGQNGTLSGTQSDVGMGGLQVGYDVACLPVGNGATFGIGVTGGGLDGQFSEDFGADDRLNGSFGQGFGGVYGDLAAGRLRAMLQGQVGVTSFSMSDPQSAVDHATLTSTRYDLSGDATYEFAFQGLSLLPEIGFMASNVASGSGDFADVGGMNLTSGATIDTYAGAILKAHMMLADGATSLSPYVSLLLHDEPVAPSTALFTDVAGGSASVPLDELGTYGDLGLGADLLRKPGPSGQSLTAGIKADFKFGSNVTENSYGGYAQVQF